PSGLKARPVALGRPVILKSFSEGSSFQNLAPSSPAAPRIWPSGLNARNRGYLGPVRRRFLPSGTSQTSTLSKSQPAIANLLLSGENAKLAPVGTSHVAFSWRDSQSFTVLSALPEASHFPSGENAKLVIGALCPGNEYSFVPMEPSQTSIVPSCRPPTTFLQ